MSNEIQKTSIDAKIIESVLLGGDLSKLSPEQRISYYNATCESLGLNPMTKPFNFIVLNGKMTLYARKDCTEQLRSNRKISLTIVSREKMEDVYIVTAKATMPDGRCDESVGAVSIANAKGDDLCNAVMKAETKAKRRVTLSISGLGLLDETELDTIGAGFGGGKPSVSMPVQKVVPSVQDAQKAVIVENPSTTPVKEEKPFNADFVAKSLKAIEKNVGTPKFNEVLASLAINSTEDIKDNATFDKVSVECWKIHKSNKAVKNAQS